MYRVLLIAEAANPERVSVPLVGWSLANALFSCSAAHLVTQVRNRDAIIRYGFEEGRDFTVLDTEDVLVPINRILKRLPIGWTGRTAIQASTYPVFEKRLWAKFGTRIVNGEFDIVHRITPLTATAVSPVAARCAAADVPFVMGPLNGGLPWPSAFNRERRKENEWLSYVRSAYKLDPRRKGTLKSASAILCGSRHALAEIGEHYRDRAIWLPENAIDPSRFPRVVARRISTPIRACFIGRLVPYKGPDMLLEAAKEHLSCGRLTLDVIGDGPLIAELKSFVNVHGISDRVTFHGWLEHRSALGILARSDLLTFPSIREFGGGVVLEAMALGVVPIVVDYGGPGELVCDATGFKIPLGDRASIVEGFRTTLQRIIHEPTILEAMSKTGSQVVLRNFSWEAKAQQVMKVYDWVKGAQLERPDFSDIVRPG